MIYQRTIIRPLFLPWNRTFVVVIYRPYRTDVRRRFFTIEHLFDSLVKNFRRRYITEWRFLTNYAEHLFSDNLSLPNICATIYHLVTCHLVIFPTRVKWSRFFPAIVSIYIHIYIYTTVPTYRHHICIYIYMPIGRQLYIYKHIHTTIRRCIHPSIQRVYRGASGVWCVDRYSWRAVYWCAYVSIYWGTMRWCAMCLRPAVCQCIGRLTHGLICASMSALILSTH